MTVMTIVTVVGLVLSVPVVAVVVVVVVVVPTNVSLYSGRQTGIESMAYETVMSGLHIRISELLNQLVSLFWRAGYSKRHEYVNIIESWIVINSKSTCTKTK
ncbi:hypothetical protein GQX74_012359 [Glossina fuscipes]|nr:hypothetical protein GQX74_012359 [Glossina fuscipes]